MKLMIEDQRLLEDTGEQKTDEIGNNCQYR